MKKYILIAVFLMNILIVSAQETEKDAIREVILTSYVDGIHNRGGIEKIENGFHPGFEMLSINNGLLVRFPIYSWLENIKKAMASGQTPTEKVTAEIPLVDVAGDAAIARIELYRAGKHLFTDYMNLYKFEDGWKIVAKTYYRIPEEK
ncbi:MAG: nuclear transport factor 2 family protein [Bacteroidales bacterium]|nr:nuclear transport factor 2 family protein [Bacteroidales bacterium]MDP2237286.1 nuclear transport factor 2 family protein [Bacteroidales bacterium]